MTETCLSFFLKKGKIKKYKTWLGFLEKVLNSEGLSKELKFTNCLKIAEKQGWKLYEDSSKCFSSKSENSWIYHTKQMFKTVYGTWETVSQLSPILKMNNFAAPGNFDLVESDKQLLKSCRPLI